MKLFSLLISTYLASSVCFAADAIKIKRNDRQYEGSGFFVRANNTIYALTSQHVVGNMVRDSHQSHVDPMCSIEIVFDKKSYCSSVISCSILHGLCALSVEVSLRQKNISIFNLQDLSHKDFLNKKVSVAGYPFYSEELYLMKGQISQNYYAKPLLYMVPSLYQLQGVSSEFGMSGGPVLSEQNTLVGMLSHQFIEEDLVQTLIVPVQFIFDWLNNLDQQGKPKSYIDFAFSTSDSSWITRNFFDLSLGWPGYMKIYKDLSYAPENFDVRQKNLSDFQLGHLFYKKLALFFTKHRNVNYIYIYIYGFDLGSKDLGYANFRSNPESINVFLSLLDHQKLVAVGRIDQDFPSQEFLDFSNSLRMIDLYLRFHENEVPTFKKYIQFFLSEQFFNTLEGFAAYSACFDDLNAILFPAQIPQAEKDYIMQNDLLYSVFNAYQKLKQTQHIIICDFMKLN